MSTTGLNTIQAPIINSSYGDNIKKTFDNIDTNFGILSNKELWKGDAGKSLVTLSIPWSILLSDPTAEWIEYEGLYFKNYYNDIVNAFSEISDNEQDITAAINQLKSTATDPSVGNGNYVVVSFIEPDPSGDSSGTTIEFVTITPYVYVDSRFRLLNDSSYSSLIDCTDMSCVISMDYVLKNNVTTGTFICTQSFPTLYFNESQGDSGLLCWIISGSKTMIPAQGPQGLNGTTGKFYVGIIADDNRNNTIAWNNLTDTDPEKAYLSHILVSLNSYSGIADKEKIPFISLKNFDRTGSDWFNATGTKGPFIDAPVILLKLPTDAELNSRTPTLYFISSIAQDNDGIFAYVTKSNTCYSYITDVSVKNSIMNNVISIPSSGDIIYDDVSSSDAQRWIPCYPIRTNAPDDSSGYAMWVQNESGSQDPKLTFGYVNKVNQPVLYSKTGSSGEVLGKYVVGGSMAVGYRNTASEEVSFTQGYKTLATTSKGEFACGRCNKSGKMYRVYHTTGNTTQPVYFILSDEERQEWVNRPEWQLYYSDSGSYDQDYLGEVIFSVGAGNLGQYEGDISEQAGETRLNALCVTQRNYDNISECAKGVHIFVPTGNRRQLPIEIGSAGAKYKYEYKQVLTG